MEKRIRILGWFDSPTVTTGFAQVSQNILKRLYKTGIYDIDIVGINHDGNPYNYKEYPYAIYPAISPLAENAELRNDVYGYNKVLNFLNSGNYDILFIIQDVFIVNNIMPQILKIQNNLPREKKFEIIHYFPVDSPLKPEWVKNVINQVAFPVTYTKYGMQECIKHIPTLENKLSYIYHGIDQNVFYPLSPEEKQETRKTIFEEHADKFIVLNVNRNQIRKDLHKTFAGFSIFHQKYPNTFLYILAQTPDVGGDLIDIASKYNLTWGTDWICPAPQTYSAAHGYPTTIVNKLYNSVDLVVSSTLGEGMGLSLLEGMATMTPVLFPYNTSMIEIIGENQERGWHIKSGKDLNFYVCFGALDNNQIRPTIDIYDMAEKMEYIILHPEEARQKAERAYAEVWKWDSIVENEWLPIFQKAQNKVQIRRNPPPHMKRNDLCPCGSGLKWKDCCGK